MFDDKELEVKIKARIAEAHYSKVACDEKLVSRAEKIHRRRKIFLWIGAALFLAILVVRLTKGSLH